MSENMNIYEKLLKIQTQLKAPKNQYNKFGGYSYRNCEDILEAIKPLAEQVQAALVIKDDIQAIGDRFYIEATAILYDCESGEHISNTAYAREELTKKGMDASQITGAASSYARKYALNGLFCIDDVKDADSSHINVTQKAATSENKSVPEKDTAQKIDPKKIQIIKELAKKYEDRGMKIEKLLNMYQLKDIKDMTTQQYNDCIAKLSLYEKGEKKKDDNTN